MKLILRKPAPPVEREPEAAQPKPKSILLLRKATTATPTEIVKKAAPEQVTIKVRNLDDLAAFDVHNSKNCLVPWYLMSSYLYYVRDVSMLSDGYYDRICHELLKDFSTIKHWHKSYVDKDQLAAGTGFRLKYSRFPLHVFAAANTLAHDVLGIKYPGK